VRKLIIAPISKRMKSFKSTFQKKREKKRRRGRKPRSTDVYITLNLNEVFKDMSRERKVLFRDFCEQLFGPRKGILLYFRDREHPLDPLVNMDSSIVKYKPEVGPLKDRLHIHALVAIEHHGFYSFEANRLRA